MNNQIAQLSEPDVMFLERVSGRDSQHRDMLAALLQRSEIVPPQRIHSDVVTMNSAVTLTDPAAHTTMTWTIVYPDDAQLDKGLLNVFSPVGMALLGARQGDQITVPLPNGGSGTMDITRVDFQPEANWARRSA
ncbi:GreA/GreB family elongation factor [Burkholderia pyrrocinia]|uniref:GreA/GreB family elongation factor n=1 Tax=Burkholderia pyrrocinia TaxID=60550 RepID=UPI00104A817A|nr:GreA/GreB family elongation factor [Burkholderia pyrrocinia]TDA45608.1 transcription elongation factor GreAB [Burkholderia pyrrocinia]